MDTLHFEEIEECIDVRIDALKKALHAHPVQFIECSCINITHAPIAVLDQSSFIEACMTITPPVVFVYREESLLDALINVKMSKISDDPIEQDRLKKKFLSSHAVLMGVAWKTCPEYNLAQCFFSVGVTLVLMGLEVVAYGEFRDALYEFGKAAKEASEAEEDKQLLKLELELQKIAERVAEDEGFISIRGRRKRAMYVLQHYRAEIPVANSTTQTEQGSELIDRNVVQVSQQAADIIEFGLCTPSLTLTD
jgi:hypothetical protein